MADDYILLYFWGTTAIWPISCFRPHPPGICHREKARLPPSTLSSMRPFKDDSLTAKRKRGGIIEEGMTPPTTTIRVSQHCRGGKSTKKPVLQLDGIATRAGHLIACDDDENSSPFMALEDAMLARPPTLLRVESNCSLGSVGVEISSLHPCVSEMLPLPTGGERPCETPPAGPAAYEAHKQ